jgi:polyferredoxin
MADRGYQQGYLYSLLYTIVMVVFGYQAMMRWRSVARDKRYQTYRYLTLLAFQVAFFLIVNVLAVQALSVKYAWRAWGLYQPYPLFFNTFFWWYDGDPKWIMTFFVGAGVVGTLVAIPIASRKHGKRFCTWVCGCGGLAETLGDRWRHLSAKGKRSRAWEFQAVVIFAASVVIAMVVIGIYETDGNNAWWRAYSYIVDFWLVAVIPIALYPFFGGKVWCRYWCPLAAYNGLLAKWYGKLKIASNEKCISCTQCSKYCQVGVDVMAFAKNQQAFDNKNSSCIQCGICIDVCPMDVLSFSTEPSETDIR